MGYVPTYFPNTSVAAEARRVSVGVGQEVPAIDVALIPGRAATISGRAIDARGQPLGGRTLQVNVEFRGPGSMQSFGGGAGPTAADGTFALNDIPPGEIRLILHGADERREAASLSLTVDGSDIDNLVLAASAGWNVGGRFVKWPSGAPSRWVRAARGDQQGQFRIRGLPPGEYFAIGVEYVEEGLWNDPEDLQSLAGYAQRVTIGDGDERVVALKVSAIDAP
jgi:hypothetical protein